MRQRDVGHEVGVSQPVVSRMELGQGGGMSLDRWAAAAKAVGLALSAHLETRTTRSVDRAERCHRLVVDTARRGGWSSATEIRRSSGIDDIETVLIRTLEHRQTELAVVRVWDEVTRVDGPISTMLRSVARERSSREDVEIRALVIIPANGANRRRISESRDLLAGTFPAYCRDWLGALTNPARKMPMTAGILWTFASCDRFRPAPLVPGWMWTLPTDGPKYARGR